MSLFDFLPDPSPRENARLLEVHQILCQTYTCPIPYFHHLDPLSELISSLLSHRTRNADSGRAFKALRKQFSTWSAVRDAPTAEVEFAIAPVTWPEQKAPRIQQVLRRLTELRSHVPPDPADPDRQLALEFLAGWPPARARAFLEELPGVGPKTSAAVLSFSELRMRALPVDSHHHRVAVRLGIIPASLAVGPSHGVMEAMLPADWSAQQVYDHHEVFMLHGQQCCFHHKPTCGRCPVLHLCPHGQARMANSATSQSLADHSSQKTSPDSPPLKRVDQTKKAST